MSEENTWNGNLLGLSYDGDTLHVVAGDIASFDYDMTGQYNGEVKTGVMDQLKPQVLSPLWGEMGYDLDTYLAQYRPDWA